MNVLFLVSYTYYEQKMSRDRFQQMAAVGRQAGASTMVWGKGFPDYDDDAPLYDNIKRVFGATAFDLVYVYKPADHKGVAACPIPKSISYNEAWNHKATIKEVLRHDVRLVIFHHANDLAILKRRWPFCNGRVLVHIPHCAERAIFEPTARPWQDRTVSVLLTGSLGYKFYPLRTRCAQFIQAGRLPWRNPPAPRLPYRRSGAYTRSVRRLCAASRPLSYCFGVGDQIRLRPGEIS